MSHAILDWMKWYPGDFWGSIAVLRLSESACNLYRWMLDYQWVHGSVPDDAVVVSRLYPWGQTALDSWREVRPFFDSVDGALVNRKLAEIYEEQLAKTSRFAAAGRLSAKVRTERYGSAQPLQGRSPERRSNDVPNNVPNDPRTSSEQGGEGRGREGKRRRAPRAAAAPPVLPFASPAFGSAWSDWVRYRSELGSKGKLTPTGATQQLAKCASMGEARSIAALRHTMAMGWVGMREPEGSASIPATSQREAELARYRDMGAGK